MADGVLVDNGAGTDYTVSTDEVTIASLLGHVQRVKLADGTDGGTTMIGGLSAWDTAAAAPSSGMLGAIAPDRRYTSVSLATAVSSTQSWDTNGSDEMTVQVGTATTGTFTFEATADGTNWLGVPVYMPIFKLWATGSNQTPFFAGLIYRVLCGGMRTVRVRTVTTLGATVSMVATVGADAQTVVEYMSAPPHAFGYTQAHANSRTTTTQTSTVVGPTVAAGSQLVVMSCLIDAGGTTAGDVTLYFGTGAFVRGTNKSVFDGGFIPSATLRPGVYMAPANGWTGAADEELRLTTSAALNPLTVTIWYYTIP